MLDPLAVPNGTPPPVLEIRLQPNPTTGQPEIHITHHLSGGWTSAVQILLQALAIAHNTEVQELKAQQTPPPLIIPATLWPRFRPERG